MSKSQTQKAFFFLPTRVDLGYHFWNLFSSAGCTVKSLYFKQIYFVHISPRIVDLPWPQHGEYMTLCSNDSWFRCWIFNTLWLGHALKFLPVTVERVKKSVFSAILYPNTKFVTLCGWRSVSPQNRLICTIRANLRDLISGDGTFLSIAASFFILYVTSAFSSKKKRKYL